MLDGITDGKMKDATVESVQAHAQPVSGATTDFDPLLEMIGEARLVLIGEASHGTHEFYRTRAEITKRLIKEKGFRAIAVEADWPDAYRLNCFVRGRGQDMLSTEALANFERFPTWMWRNTVVADFAGWLREYNAALPPGTPQTGFYGMDLYSLYQSIKAVVGYLEKIDPEAAKRARSRYACFEHAGEDPQAYGYAASFDVTDSCRDEVVAQLVELQRHFGDYASRDGRVAEDEAFYAEQNARLAKNAEEYYRSMFAGRVSSWNLRDCHMAETLDELLNFLDKQNGGKTRMVVWAHNSHLGDASATQMGRMGELNVGQVVRQRYDREAVLIGFTTYTGTVTAASDWDEPAERKRVRPGLPGSYESLFHEAGGNFWLNLRDTTELRQTLGEEWLERAIGVIYRPDTERISHYFKANLPRQFDAIIHLDETRALEPLEPTTGWHAGEEVPETYPTAL